MNKTTYKEKKIKLCKVLGQPIKISLNSRVHFIIKKKLFKVLVKHVIMFKTYKKALLDTVWIKNDIERTEDEQGI